MFNLKLLGGFELAQKEGEAPVRLGAKPQGLVAHLAMSAGTPVPRGRLAGLLWGERDEERARQNLRQALSTIRRAFGPAGQDLIQTREDGVQLNEVGVDLDVERFELLANSEDQEKLQKARELYRGEFLQGLDLSEPDYEEWMLGERYRLAEIAATAFSRLLDMQVSAGPLEEAVDTARDLIAVTPLDESAHARLIALYATQNRRGLAESHYNRCRELFRRELDRDPGNEIEDAIKSAREHKPGNDQDPTSNQLINERRLTTILAADIAGYSRLMAQDEAGTLASIKDLRSRLIDPKATMYRGRVVKLMGDGALMEFGSVVDAVNFAVDIQTALIDQNREVPDKQQINIRIGINVGDIIVDGDEIYGDGVSIATRLEGLAEPGGICISGTVYDHVQGKVGASFDDLGKQDVENLPKPVQAYTIILDIPSTTSRLQSWTGRVSRRPGWTVIAGVFVLLTVFAGATQVPRIWMPDDKRPSESDLALPLPDKPSLAVLPFANLSNDPNQEVFVDGLTEDLITDLSKISGLFVIARNSTFVYKDTQVEIRTVAETLGVRYVLEGSVRREGDQLRVNAQLIDATTGGHLWADRFDGEVTNVFAVQDEFVLKIVKALAVELSESEKREIGLGKTNNIEAREAFQRGWELYSKFNAQDNAKADSHLQKAIELDPEFGRAHAALALVYYRGYRFSWEREMGRSWERLRKLTADTLKMAQQYPTPLFHVVAALENVNLGLADQARSDAAQAIAMQPNDPEAHIAMAFAMIISGRPWEGLSSVQTAMRLNPRYPSSYVFAQGIAHFAIGDLEEAAITLEEGHAGDPMAIELLPVLASILAQLDRRQEARDTVLKWRPGSSQMELRILPDEYQLPVRWSLEHRRVRERLIDGLRVAVLPLDTTVSSLLDKLKVVTPFDRSAVVRTLGWFGPSAAVAVPDLIQALSDEQQQVRVEAAITLGKIGPKAKAAIPVLAAMSDDVSVGFHAKEALKEIIGN